MFPWQAKGTICYNLYIFLCRTPVRFLPPHPRQSQQRQDTAGRQRHLNHVKRQACRLLGHGWDGSWGRHRRLQLFLPAHRGAAEEWPRAGARGRWLRDLIPRACMAPFPEARHRPRDAHSFTMPVRCGGVSPPPARGVAEMYRPPSTGRPSICAARRHAHQASLYSMRSPRKKCSS